MLRACKCHRCINNDYNPLDYIVTDEDYVRLDEARPFGITGHLRVKNEGTTLRQCLDSVINVLDEIVITYQTSEDTTEEILKEYALLYPKKIRLFHYKPYVPGFTYLEKADPNIFTDNIDYKSIHNPANYYNFGYVKTRYQYYIKIDGDQIYFTKKLRLLKRLLRLKSTLQTKGIRYIFSYIIFYFMKHIPFRRDLRSYYKSFKKNNLAFILGGINLYFKDNELAVLSNIATDSNRKIVSDTIISPLNGCVGDTVIFIPSSERRYLWSTQNLVEYLPLHGLSSTYFGLCWWHLGFCKPLRAPENISDCYHISPYALSTTSEKILKNTLFNFNSNSSYNKQYFLPIFKNSYEIALQFWNKDKKYIDYKKLKKIPPTTAFYKK